MSEKDKNTNVNAVTNAAGKGRYRWVAEYKNGEVKGRYNKDGSKNVYHGLDSSGTPQAVSRKGIKTWGFTDVNDKPVTVLDVPDGAQVFKRRRVMDINYYNRFHDVEETLGGKVEGGRWVPEQKVVHRYPEYTYSEVWLIGWRLRVGGGVKVQFKAVYPDGKIDEYTAWDLQPWLYEPEWFSEEQV